MGYGKIWNNFFYFTLNELKANETLINEIIQNAIADSCKLILFQINVSVLSRLSGDDTDFTSFNLLKPCDVFIPEGNIFFYE